MIFNIQIKVCDVLQLETKTNSLDYVFGRKLFKLHEKRIAQASKNVRETFTVDNIAIAFANYRYLNDIINNSTKQAENLKLPLYQSLINPCFLLIVCSKIKNNKI
jgi:hypothetical protein